jgi:hypothetical protein
MSCATQATEKTKYAKNNARPMKSMTTKIKFPQKTICTQILSFSAALHAYKCQNIHRFFLCMSVCVCIQEALIQYLKPRRGKLLLAHALCFPIARGFYFALRRRLRDAFDKVFSGFDELVSIGAGEDEHLFGGWLSISSSHRLPT